MSVYNMKLSGWKKFNWFANDADIYYAKKEDC